MTRIPYNPNKPDGDNDGEEWKEPEKQYQNRLRKLQLRINYEINKSDRESYDISQAVKKRPPTRARASAIDQGGSVERWCSICLKCSQSFYTAILGINDPNSDQIQVILPCPFCGAYESQKGVRPKDDKS